MPNNTGMGNSASSLTSPVYFVNKRCHIIAFRLLAGLHILRTESHVFTEGYGRLTRDHGDASAVKQTLCCLICHTTVTTCIHRHTVAWY